MKNLKLDEYDQEILGNYDKEIGPLNAEIERLGVLRQQAITHRDAYVRALLQKAKMDTSLQYRLDPEGQMIVPVEPEKKE